MRRTRLGIAAAVVGALALTACSSGSSSKTAKDNAGNASKQQASIPLGTATDSTGPATPVAGAKPGGTLNVLQRDSYAHLDPAQIYVSDEGSLATLYSRQLTTYKVVNGKTTLVGDLATDSGKVSDGGKTWTFTLKDGVKFQDGKQITSADVRQSIERMYAPFITDGPAYIQQWLSGTGTAYRKALPDGPYKGKHLPDSVLSTPDSKTIVFHFLQAEPDTPFALGMAGYGIIEASKDTQQKYDVAPVASGPYKIQSFKADKSLVLVKNPEWDPKTDSARHQYVDTFNITFGHQYSDSTQQLLSDSDPTAVSFNNTVDPTLTSKVLGDAAAMKRSVAGYQPYVGQYNINVDRITDKKVREALALAIPAKTILALNGGSTAGEVANSLISPTVSGYDATYDPLNRKTNPNGDPAAAKKLLTDAGKVGQKIVYAYSNTEIGQKVSVAVDDALTKAGFTVARKELDSATYYTLVSKKNNPYDFFATAWGADWPSASTVVPPLYDGRAIQDGSSNYSHINVASINSGIDAANKITDPAKAAAAWAKLAKDVQDTYAVVPTFYYKSLQLYGSKVGGVIYNDVIGSIDPTKLYVKS
jgi:peptide/nickel transport system substrate-binding protein